MTLVLVHGVPETDALWEPLRRALGRQDVVALSPPGFGAPVPDGFDGTADSYLDWLVRELERLDGPVDLLGHDWGGAHVQRVAAARPDLVRSWASDSAGITDPGYTWHDLAQAWQTPEVGEGFVAAVFGGSPEEQVGALTGYGVPALVAESIVKALGPDTGRCLLALYRSAVQPACVRWGAELERAERRPCLVLNATEDPFTGGPDRTHDAAVRFGATEVVLDGLGHWWMLEDPERAAAELTAFHAGLVAP